MKKINKSFYSKEEIYNSKHGLLNYRKIEILDKYSKIEVDLITGRHHQIRCQLSNIGCYIKGDIKYGAKRPNKNKSISLHSKKIEFIHPVSKLNILVEAKPPDESIWLN